MNDKTEKCAKKGTEGLVQLWLGQYIAEVFERFKNYAENEDDLSVLWDLDFRNNVSETSRNAAGSNEERGYKNKHVRDFYIVRYAYAYEYEYRKMYEILLDKIKAEQGYPGKLQITTIGCGNMIDCWGFADALGRLENNYKYEYIYRGIDLIDWGDLRIDNWMNIQKRPDGEKGYYLPGSKRKDRQASFTQADVSNEILKEAMISDVYTFANSISELDENLLRNFCNSITAENGKDRFFLLITIRDSTREISTLRDSNRDKDLKKVKLIVDELRKRGYDTQDDFENPVSHEGKIKEDGQRSYREIVKNEGWEFLNELNRKLNWEKAEGEKVRVYPILDAGLLHYLVLSFKKK